MELNENYDKVIRVIKREEERAEKDYFDNVEVFFSTNKLSYTDIIKVCIEWKSNYLKNSNSKYFILKQYLNKDEFSFAKKSEVVYQEFLIFINGLYPKGKVLDKNMLDCLAEDIYTYKKSELYYFAGNKLIDLVNSNNKTQLKLPPIENFEQDIFNQLIESLNKKEELLNKGESIFDKHIASYEKTLADKDTENNEQFKLIQNLKRQLSDVNFEIDGLKFSNSLLLEEIKRVDYIPVQQFDVLFWGDNYPALKVLFDFLQKMNMIDFNWSYFSNLMCVGNNECFNLNTTTISKADIGYLIYKIKPFFKHEYSNSTSKYSSWLFRKLFIDNSQIDNNYIKKYVRGYKSGKNPLKNKNIIDNLCEKISLRYN